MSDPIEDARQIPEGLPHPGDLPDVAAIGVAHSIYSTEDLRIFLSYEVEGPCREEVVEDIKDRMWSLREDTYAVIDHTEWGGGFAEFDEHSGGKIWAGRDEKFARELADSKPEYELVEVSPAPEPDEESDESGVPEHLFPASA